MPDFTKPKLSQDFGDWRVLCVDQPVRACQLFQRLFNTTDKSLLLWTEFTHLATPSPTTRMSIVVPLGLRIGPPIRVQVDGQTWMDLPLVTCVKDGCVHNAEVPSVGFRVFEQANAATVAVRLMNGQVAGLTMSLRGFKEASQRSAAFLKS